MDHFHATSTKCERCSTVLRANPQLASEPPVLKVCDYCGKRACPSCRTGTVCTKCSDSARASDVE